MSVAYYIVLDKEEPGFDTFVNGKALAHEKRLESLCKKLGLKTFEDFLTMSGDDIADMIGEHVDSRRRRRREMVYARGRSCLRLRAGYSHQGQSQVGDGSRGVP